jgi:DNA-binding XRE family transcriptional regulator
MPQPKPENQRQRNQRAEDWKMFRSNNLLTQKRLAAIIGVSRRTIQQIEGGYITPQTLTLKRFAILRSKYDANADINLQA